jgi:hypothetical protein
MASYGRPVLLALLALLALQLGQAADTEDLVRAARLAKPFALILLVGSCSSL